MSEKIFSGTNAIYIFAALLLFVLRIYLGRAASFAFPPWSYHDDAMLVKYADLHNHFISQTLPYHDRLVKDMGFPLFLYLTKFSGILYTDAVVALYFFAAIFFTIFFSKLTGTKDRLLLIAVYSYVLFLPVAFSIIGIRIYRSAVMVPLYFIVLTLLAILFVLYFKEPEIN